MRIMIVDQILKILFNNFVKSIFSSIKQDQNIFCFYQRTFKSFCNVAIRISLLQSTNDFVVFLISIEQAYYLFSSNVFLQFIFFF